MRRKRRLGAKHNPAYDPRRFWYRRFWPGPKKFSEHAPSLALPHRRKEWSSRLWRRTQMLRARLRQTLTGGHGHLFVSYVNILFQRIDQNRGSGRRMRLNSSLGRPGGFMRLYASREHDLLDRGHGFGGRLEIPGTVALRDH